MRHPFLDHLLLELKTELHRLYSDQLVHVVLFGSQARGDAELYSDIDVMIVLQGEVDYTLENRRVSQFFADLSLKYNTVVSRHFMSAEDFANAQSPLMLNVRHEGELL